VQDQSSPSALGTRHLNTKSLVSPLDVPNIREIVAKFVLATSIVLAMAMGLIWLCRMCLASKAHSARGGERIRLRATANLGSRCFAQLLEVDDRLVLVGRDATGIKSMLALDRPFGAELDGLTGDERFSAEVA
jgi:flagellar biogenesis protein FliO